MSETIFYTHEVNADSSAMDSILYAAPEQKMFIKWKNNTISAYDDVSRAHYEEFATAPSKGAFFNSRIHNSSRWQVGNRDVTLVKANQTVSVEKSDTHIKSYIVTHVVRASSWDELFSVIKDDDVTSIQVVP